MRKSALSFNVLCMIIFVFGSFFAVNSNRNQEICGVSNMLPIYLAVGEKFFLDDSAALDRIEKGEVVSIGPADVKDKRSPKAKNFGRYFGWPRNLQSLSFFMIGNDICMICKADGVEKMLMGKGDTYLIP